MSIIADWFPYFAATYAAMLAVYFTFGAVATAVGDNPVSVIIPCHRVLRRHGELGGYRWGLQRKLALLGWELAREDQPSSAASSSAASAATSLSG